MRLRITAVRASFLGLPTLEQEPKARAEGVTHEPMGSRVES